MQEREGTSYPLTSTLFLTNTLTVTLPTVPFSTSPFFLYLYLSFLLNSGSPSTSLDCFPCSLPPHLSGIDV